MMHCKYHLPNESYRMGPNMPVFQSRHIRPPRSRQPLSRLPCTSPINYPFYTCLTYWSRRAQWSPCFQYQLLHQFPPVSILVCNGFINCFTAVFRHKAANQFFVFKGARNLVWHTHTYYVLWDNLALVTLPTLF